MPGTLMAMARLNRPALMIYGGTIKPGHSKMDGSVLDIVSAFQSYGEWCTGCTAYDTCYVVHSHRAQSRLGCPAVLYWLGSWARDWWD